MGVGITPEISPLARTITQNQRLVLLLAFCHFFNGLVYFL